MTRPKTAFQKVSDAVKDMFDALRAQFLPKEGKNLNIGFTSLPDLYNQSVRASGGVPNPETAESLMEIAETYLDAAQARTEANIKHVLQAHKHSKKDEQPIDVHTAIEEQVEKATSEVDRIVDTESQRARSVGAWEGINQAAAKMGIDDPTVFFVVVRDQYLCDECKRLHLLPDLTTPRVWKMSEISHEYHVRGQENPSIQGLHPHCRCTKTILFPGFGFDSDGATTYISPGYDEYAKQRGQI